MNAVRVRRLREAATGYLFIAPAVLLFLVFGITTLAYGFRLSFVRWNGISPTWTGVGLQNYKDLLWADPGLSQEVRAAFLRTGYVMVAMSVGLVVVSLPLALALHTTPRFKTALRTIYFLPYVTTGIAVFYAWRFILLPDGGLNRLLDAVGLDSLVSTNGLLAQPSTALATSTAILLWATVPFGIVLYLAGLQSIEPSLLEAAKIDGASTWQVFARIQWPLLRPVTALLVAVGLRTALQEFQVFLLMTKGGPLNGTTTASLFSFQLAFGSSSYGYASALGWSLFLLGIVISGLSFLVLRRRD